MAGSYDKTFKTRTTYRWLATQPRLVCLGCFRDIPLDGAELARRFVAS
jgi:hypothetical protein